MSLMGDRGVMEHQRRVSMKTMRGKTESVGQMEVLSLLPTSSWTVLVSLISQNLSYHPPGAEEELRSECSSCSLRKVPVPNNISVVQ